MTTRQTISTRSSFLRDATDRDRTFEASATQTSYDTALCPTMTIGQRQIITCTPQEASLDWVATSARPLATTTAQWRTTQRRPIVDTTTAQAVVDRVAYRTPGEEKSTAAVADEAAVDAAVVDNTSVTWPRTWAWRGGLQTRGTPPRMGQPP